MKTIQQKFEEKYIPEPMSGCWLWTGACTKTGHGHLNLKGKYFGAHRVAWTLYRGPIPEGLEIDHLCRNPYCVNPDHLEPVTRRVNLLRGNTIPAKHAAKTHCPQGHAYTPDNIYWRKNMRLCRICVLARSKQRYRRLRG